MVGHATEHDTVCVVQEHLEGFVALCDGPVDEGYRHGVRVCALGDGDGLRDAGVVMGVSGAPKRGADFAVPQILRGADFAVPQWTVLCLRGGVNNGLKLSQNLCRCPTIRSG